MRRIIPFIALAIVLASSSAWAADATAAVDLNSAYVWRGITLNDGLVAQPSLDVTKGGFGFNVWGNFDLSDYNNTLDENNFSEVDLTLSYAFSIKKLDVGVGVIEYLFPTTAKTGGPGTRELYATLGMNIIGGLSAGIGYYHDVDEVHSYYSDFSLTYSFSPMDKLDVEAGAKVAYAGKDFATYYSAGATDGGWYDYGFSLGLTYAVSNALSVGANINYTDTLDKKVLPETNQANGIFGHDTSVYGGVNVSYAF